MHINVQLVGLREAVVEREREREQLKQQLTTLQSTLSHRSSTNTSGNFILLLLLLLLLLLCCSEERGGEFGERVRKLEREVGGAREREEGLRGELAAMREVRDHTH